MHTTNLRVSFRFGGNVWYNAPMMQTTHTTLYRAYRPHTFDDICGQSHVVDVLKAAIKNKKIAHAYLFAGTRGTGKTSIARIMARELGITDKDLYEIDAASNRGIDDIRELREGVFAMPFDSPYKLYIIDEAHMLTKEAWNALLKTLEEPPAHALFVLATTELHKVPDTIQSRCESYSFKQPTREVLAKHITAIAQKEGHTIEPAGAELVALLAEGSFRDALSLLQKVLSFAGTKKNVSITDVEAVSGAPAGETLRKLLTALVEKDTATALATVRTAVEHNIEPRLLTRLLIHRLRAVLLLRYAPDIAPSLAQELTEADLEQAQSLAKKASINSDTLRAFLESYSQMAYAAVPYLPLELAIVDSTQKSVTQ